MKILFYKVRHFSPNFHEFTGSKTIFKKKKKILPKNLRKKKLSKSVSGYYKTKKETKKVAWTTKPIGVGRVKP